MTAERTAATGRLIYNRQTVVQVDGLITAVAAGDMTSAAAIASVRLKFWPTVRGTGQFSETGGPIPAATDEISRSRETMPLHEFPQILLHPVKHPESTQHNFGANLNNRCSQEHEFRRIKTVCNPAAGHDRQSGRLAEFAYRPQGDRFDAGA